LGADQPSSMHVGGGGGAGKVSFQDLTCNANVDKSYPTMLVFCASGKHVSKVQIAGARPVATRSSIQDHTRDVLVTNVGVSGANGAQVSVNYSFQAAKVKSEYSLQTKDGGKGATSEFGWTSRRTRRSDGTVRRLCDRALGE